MKKNCQYPKIITFSGLDGSGKSTQIELLKKYLQEEGKSFWYFHAVEFSVGNRAQSAKLKAQNSGSVTNANWLQIKLRKIALIIDIFRFKRLMKNKKVNYIISDRYFYDSAININFLSEKSGKLFSEKYIPKPDYAFFIKVSPEKIMQRERKPDQGMEYLIAKDKLFKEKQKDWKMIIVDGERDKKIVFEDIISKIEMAP